MEILGASLRICVDDLEAAIPFYERLAGGRALRFDRGGVRVAAIGSFLLMSGPEPELEILRKVTATIAVKDVDEAHRLLTELGARIVAGPVPTPVGRNLLAMHPDGSVFEYVDQRGRGGSAGSAQTASGRIRKS
ncbi:VOC family protein [Streptomyces sp. NPDC048521]|uniref:VOC family protein n=1 Tax=Streptomyces sp. NPDC048521 TaxID=3365566 RepID=UPI00371163AE